MAGYKGLKAIGRHEGRDALDRPGVDGALRASERYHHPKAHRITLTLNRN